MTPPAGLYTSNLEALPTVALIRRALIQLTAKERDLAEEANLNIMAARALVTISEADARGKAFNPAALAPVLDMTSASMTNTVDRLERAGYVERRHSTTDRRSLTLHPTREGSEVEQRIQQRLDDFIYAGLAGFSEQEQAVLRRGLIAVASLKA